MLLGPQLFLSSCQLGLRVLVVLVAPVDDLPAHYRSPTDGPRIIDTGHGFGMLAPEVQAAIFPKEMRNVLYSGAQLGVGLYMFLVGTTLRLDHFATKARSAIGVSVRATIHAISTARPSESTVFSSDRPMVLTSTFAFSAENIAR